MLGRDNFGGSLTVERTQNGRVDQNSERRKQIVAISARLFASRGYSATTVRDIAEDSGILSGSLYHHFASKEEIFQEILRSFMDGVLEQFEAIVASGLSPRETLDGLIETAFQVIEEQPDAVGLYQNESSFLQTQPDFAFLTEKSNRIEQIWREQIIAGQKEGAFRANLDDATVYRFIRDSVWATVRWYRPGGHHTAATVCAHFLDHLHHGMLSHAK